MLTPATELTTNLKTDGGKDVAYTLTPLSIVYGPNASGKTAVLESIRLCLTGKHPVGRSAQSLGQLAHSDLACVLTAPSWGAAFRLSRGKPDKSLGGDLRALSVGQREALLPTHSMREILGFGQKRDREALLARFGAEKDSIEVPASMSPRQHDLLVSGAKEVQEQNPTMTLAEILAALGGWLRSESLTAGRQMKAVEERIAESRQDWATSGIGHLSLQELEAQLGDAIIYESQAGQRQRVQYAREALTSMNEALPLYEEELHDALADCSEHDDECGNWCGECGQPLDDAARTADQRQKDLDDLKHRISEQEDRLVAVQEGLVEYDGPSAQDLRARIAHIRESDVARANLSKDNDTLAELKTRQADLKALSEQMPKIIADTFADVYTDAEDAVDSFLPPGCVATLDPDSGEWGLATGTRRLNKHQMSGAQKQILALARMLAYAPPGEKIVLLDDEDIGLMTAETRNGLFAQLRALQEAGKIIQVIAAVRTETGEEFTPPDGWSAERAKGRDS